MQTSKIQHSMLFVLIAILSSYCSCYCATDVGYISLQSISQKHNLLPIKSISPKCAALSANGYELKFQNSSRFFCVNGINLSLGFPCEIRAGKLSISESDYLSHIAAFFKKKENLNKPKITIVLDPGHGGQDSGAISIIGEKEKNMALDICMKVAKILSDKGYAVHLTRNSDVFIEIEKRAYIANQKSADLFVSVHCNSAKSKDANGVEAFTLTPYGQPSQVKAFRQQTDFVRYPNNKFDQSSFLLAYNIQKAIIESTKSADRGVKHGRFIVLRNLNCPGLIIECGFLSNREDRAKLASNAYRQTLAQAIVCGIIKYLD